MPLLISRRLIDCLVPLVPVAFAGIAAAQPSAVEEHQDRVFQIHQDTAPGFQEMVDIVRTMTNLQQAIIDPNARTLHVIGTKGELAAADWMLAWLDRSMVPRPREAPWRTLQTNALHRDALRILLLTHIGMSAFARDIVKALRSISGEQRVLICNAQSAIVLRSTPKNAALAEWLVPALDAPRGQSVALPYDGDTVRVYYLPNIHSSRAFDECVSRIRSAEKTATIGTCFLARAIVVRGTAAQFRVIERLVRAGNR
jgi:hypothetical protein